MTYTASLHLNATDASRLATAFGEDQELAALSLDISEAAPGDWLFVAYFEGLPGRGVAERMARLAAATLGKGTAPFLYEKLPQTDWVKKSLADLKPVRAGRFLVHGGHDRGRRRPNDIAIEIEAGEAFGTGHHGTTAGCLLAIDRAVRVGRRRRPLDVGTGSGVLAIAAAKAWHRPVAATDIDPVAVRVAAENSRLNGVAALVKPVVANDLKGAAIRRRAPYDFILANILAGPLQTLAPQIFRVSAPGAEVILSGLLPDQRARITSAYRSAGFVLSRWQVLDGWLTMTFERSPGRRVNQKGRRSGRPSS
jgi:ribosomal protein L11 methyltransferase